MNASERLSALEELKQVPDSNQFPTEGMAFESAFGVWAKRVAVLLSFNPAHQAEFRRLSDFSTSRHVRLTKDPNGYVMLQAIVDAAISDLKADIKNEQYKLSLMEEAARAHWTTLPTFIIVVITLIIGVLAWLFPREPSGPNNDAKPPHSGAVSPIAPSKQSNEAQSKQSPSPTVKPQSKVSQSSDEAGSLHPANPAAHGTISTSPTPTPPPEQSLQK